MYNVNSLNKQYSKYHHYNRLFVYYLYKYIPRIFDNNLNIVITLFMLSRFEIHPSRFFATNALNWKRERYNLHSQPLQPTFTVNLYSQPLQSTFTVNLYSQPLQPTFKANVYSKPYK